MTRVGRLLATGTLIVAALTALDIAVQVDGQGLAQYLAMRVAGSWKLRQAVERLSHLDFPWWLYVAPMAAILVLERLAPAEPARRQSWVSTGQDAVWFGIEMVARATAYFYLAGALAWAHDRWLDGATLEVARSWPVPVRAIVGVLVYDLVGYGHHLAHHKIPWLWSFHALHHSQVHLSFFTVARFHFVERLSARVVIFAPLLLLGLSQTETAVTAWLLTWHPRFCHANIRANLGPLRYLVVTPQSHRVHHSRDPRFRDKNLATHFPIWDMLFGTHYYGRHEFPETGIDDRSFPLERSGRGFLTMAVAQTLYPFRQLVGARSRVESVLRRR